MDHTKLNIALYTSTRGHFGFKNSYQFTVERLIEKIPMWDSFYKLAHIKISNNEVEVANDMQQWLEEKGFEVITSVGEWKHNDQANSHAKAYYADMLKVFSQPKILDKPYTLFIEDDWLIETEDTQFLSMGLLFLNQNRDSLCVRINNKNENILGKDKIKENDDIYSQGRHYTQYGPTLTFQPTIIRTNEWYHSLRIINKNSEILDKNHCKLVSGQVIGQFSDSKTPFAFFNPNLVKCEHIGEKEKLEVLNERQK